jgi:hypothetical protein
MSSNPSQPYVIAALITSVPATIAAVSAWRSSHKGRVESVQGDEKLTAHITSFNERFDRLDTKLEKAELNFARMDLRFDGIEDKVERHLGWHRAEAEAQLPIMLSKETTNGNTNHPND